MLYLYSIFSIVIIGTSLLAMDKKPNNSGAQKESKSFHMQSVPNPGQYRVFENNKGVTKTVTVYKYADESRSTYNRYSDQKK